jgi:D-tyrosyl-tRNA(Tyr) deacylase
MRAVVQRVKEAHLTINQTIEYHSGAGLLVLLGIEQGDDLQDIEWLSGKISRLRIFNDQEGKMNLSVMEVGGEVMIVSQFTLHASTKKGNRPSYIKAAQPEVAIPIYQKFVSRMEQDLAKTVIKGEFGAYMQINLVNDGPVTIIIDTKNRE